MIKSNYLGNGKRLDDPKGKGVDVTVSRGPHGEFMYDFEPMRREADRIQALQPRSVVHAICPIHDVAIAGFTSTDPDGSVIEIVPSPAGFLTKPTRIWYQEEVGQ